LEFHSSACRTEVGLRGLGGSTYGFHFNYDSSFDYQIDSVSDFQLLTFVYNRPELEPRLADLRSQFMSQTRLISTFEKSGAGAGDCVDVNRMGTRWRGHA